MKKFFILILMARLACTCVFAGGKKDKDYGKTNVLAGYSAMQMDMVSYENTVYDAVIAMDQTDVSKGTSIIVNKYVNNSYDSSLQLDVEGFKTHEFSENYSHYDFVKLYALGPNEIILTLYSGFSDNRFAFFRIKDEKVIAYKTYNLKNQKAYESQQYAFNGKDRIYVAFDGKHDFSKSHWDLFLLAFDLEGKLINSVSIYTNDWDELIGLAASENHVYFGIRRAYENQGILQLTKDLEYEKCLMAKYAGSGIRTFDVESELNSDNLILRTYMENQDTNFIRLNGDGDFICSYKRISSNQENTYCFYKTLLSSEGITFLEQRGDEERYFNQKLEVAFASYFMDWDGNKTYEREYKEKNNYNLAKFAFVDGKYLCNGVTIFTGDPDNSADGIGHIYYNYLIDGETKETNFVSFEKSDYNPFAIPTDTDLEKSYNSAMQFWEKKIKVEKEEIPTWDFSYEMKKIKLDFKHESPYSPEITDSVPLFPFSER